MTVSLSVVDQITSIRKAACSFMVNVDNHNCISLESSPKRIIFAVNNAGLDVIRMKIPLKSSVIRYEIPAISIQSSRSENMIGEKISNVFYGPFDSVEYSPRTDSYQFNKRIFVGADDDAEKIFEMIDVEISAACIDLITSRGDMRYVEAAHVHNLSDSSFFPTGYNESTSFASKIAAHAISANKLVIDTDAISASSICTPYSTYSIINK